MLETVRPAAKETTSTTATLGKGKKREIEALLMSSTMKKKNKSMNNEILLPSYHFIQSCTTPPLSFVSYSKQKLSFIITQTMLFFSKVTNTFFNQSSKRGIIERSSDSFLVIDLLIDFLGCIMKLLIHKNINLRRRVHHAFQI